LTWAEFEELTLAQLEALEERRAIEVRQGRFNAALITSTLINSHRAEDSDPISPFDFLAGFERDEEEEERDKLRTSIKRAVALAFAQMRGLGPEAVQAEKAAMIQRMTASGVEDPEGLIREVFPEL
jgi:hypothetical protein